jgi:hypothetical protein
MSHVLQRLYAEVRGLTKRFRAFRARRLTWCRDALQRHEATHAEQYTSLLQTGARACTSCATARVKCSGGRSTCQRCERRGWLCIYPSDGAAGNPLSVQTSSRISDGGLDATLDNSQAADVFLDLEAQQGPADNDFWDPSILASTNWLGSIDLDAFDPTLPEFDAAFALPEPSRPRSVADGSPRPIVTAASPAATVTTGTTSTSQDKQTEDGEYYVDGQPARLPRVKRRRTSKAAPIVQSTQTTWSLQEPVLAQGSLFQAFVISDDSHEMLHRLYRQLCLTPGSLYKSFDNHEFPSKAFFETLVAATIASVTSILPFFHHSQSAGDPLHWLEVVALASLACHFAELSPKHRFTISMHEFVRRLIHWVDEQDKLVEGVNDLVLARTLIMHASGAAYCGDHRLCRYALGLNARLCAAFRQLILVYHQQSDLFRDHTDPAFLAWRNRESFARLLYSIWLHDCMTAYHFQRKPSLALADAAIPLPCQEKLWSVRSENEWRSITTQSAVLLSPPPALIEALQQLYVDKWLPRERGEFARVLMIHALLHRSWEVEAYYKNPLSHWNPVAQRQDSADVLPSGEIWLPAIPAFTKWQNSACDALDVLHWQANAMIGQSSGLEHPTVLHLHVARIVLLAPYLEIITHVQSMTGISVSETQEETCGLRTVNHSNPAALSIRRWAINHQYKARLAAIHAGVVFWHVRRYSTDAYHEGPSIALAALTLWAFGTYARKQPPTVRQGVGNPPVGSTSHHPAPLDEDDDDDLESCNIILLDRPTDDELVQQFIKNGDRMEAHISGVGDLYAPQSPRLVLKQACKLLRQSEKCWGIAGRWLQLLERLAELST